MFDLPAMPIAFALTLWDAAPIFLSVSLALAVITRATTAGPRFADIWRVRDAVGIEGAVYLAVFEPSLVPLLLISSVALVIGGLRWSTPPSPVPRSPGNALRLRAEDVILPVLVGSAAAAYIKVAGPHISEYGWSLEIAFAAATGALVGNRYGTVAITVVAVSVHLGGIASAGVCILAATIRSLVMLSRSRGRVTETSVSSPTR